MRLTLIVALGIVLGQGLVVADEKSERYVEQAKGFSFVPPNHWKMWDAAALAKQEAESRQEFEKAQQEMDKAVQDQRAAMQNQTAGMKQQIMKQLKGTQPGSFQEKVLKQQLDVLERMEKQIKETPKETLERLEKEAKQDKVTVNGAQVTQVETKSFLEFWGAATDGPVPNIRFSVPKLVRTRNGEVVKNTLADFVAYYKHPEWIN